MTSLLTYKTTSFSSQNLSKNTPVFHSTSSGKEKDSETGYYYFGARYYNSDLSLWLSVDPMSDKYPNLSPYNYCAWNPMKLVDPDGEEIDVSSLSESMQNRLVRCLGFITGLKLNIESGKLVSEGYSKSKLYSKSARKDLLEAITSTDKSISVKMGTKDEGGNGLILLRGNHDNLYDNETNGLGMAFFHELGHAYFGDDDPPEWGNGNWFVDNGGDYPEFGGPIGDAVARVNVYRKELHMPLRMTYESCDGMEGNASKFNGLIPFEGKHKGGWNGVMYLKLK